jgi:hypothetical protein
VEQRALDAAFEHLEECYAMAPEWVTPEDWAIERQILATCFATYLWHYQDDPTETLATEHAFRMPLFNPRTGMQVPESRAVREGTIDRVVRWRGKVGHHEYKSTSSSIDDGGKYWEAVRHNDQVSMYALAFRDGGEDFTESLGITDEDEVGPTLYDVWHKPKSRPKMLTQKETAELLESGEYYGDEYTVELAADRMSAAVDGVGTLAKPGKAEGSVAIRETPAMFGSRLMAEIMAEPDTYFRRRPVVRTAKELDEFERELYNIYLSMRNMLRDETFYSDKTQCRATWTCEMVPVCHGPVAVDDVCDGETTPAGFHRVPTEITVGGKAIS